MTPDKSLELLTREEVYAHFATAECPYALRCAESEYGDRCTREDRMVCVRYQTLIAPYWRPHAIHKTVRGGS